MSHRFAARAAIILNRSRALLPPSPHPQAYDRHLNIVLGDAEEFRSVKLKGGDVREDKRVLGLVLLRGVNVISLQIVRPVTAKKTGAGAGAGAGAARAAGRGTVVAAAAPAAAPEGLGGAVRGVGGPSAAALAPMPPGMPMMGMMPPGFGGGPPPGFYPPFMGMPPPGFPPGGFAPPPPWGMPGAPRPPM